MDQELEIRENADQSDEKGQTSRNKSTEKGKSPLSTASGLMAKSVTCTFCKGTHSPKECSIPMSVEDRFNKMREAKACFRCARTGHRIVTCKHRKPCQCGRGPHILQLCKTGGVKNPDAGNPPSVNVPNHPSWNPAAPPFLPSQSQTPSTCQPQAAATSSAKNADIKSTGVMMRTVCVAIGNVTVRALCDTRATFTLTSSQLASIVQKKVVGKRRLRIETVGDVLDGEFNVVEVTVRGVNLANTFQAVVVNNLSGVFERVDPDVVSSPSGGCRWSSNPC